MQPGRDTSDRRSRLWRNCHIVVQRWRLAGTPGGLLAFLGKACALRTRARRALAYVAHAPWQIRISA
eukprot:7803336-Alexandrium_andersonii.AAC.1